MGFIDIRGGNLHYEEKGDGVPILLVHPAGADASMWDAVAGELTGFGRVVTYDRRGYARSGGDPVRSIPEHTADAAVLLEAVHAIPAVVVGTSVGANIVIDLALHRPDLVAAAIAYESPWRATRHPTAAGLAAMTRMQWLQWRNRPVEAAETFLRWAYTYPDGGSAWDAFPDQWRNTAREGAKAVLADVRLAVSGYPRPRELARMNRPVVCAYGARSRGYMLPVTRSLARAIPTATLREVEGAGHAVAFDAPREFAHLIADVGAAPDLHADT